MWVTGSSTSAPGGVVKSTMYSPWNDCPASWSIDGPSSAAASLIAALRPAAVHSAVAREAVVIPHSTRGSLTVRTRMSSSASPVSSWTTWRRMVCSPWPISVKPVRISTRPSSSISMSTRPVSSSPLPIPVFLMPQAIPALGAVL